MHNCCDCHNYHCHHAPKDHAHRLYNKPGEKPKQEESYQQLKHGPATGCRCAPGAASTVRAS